MKILLVLAAFFQVAVNVYPIGYRIVDVHSRGLSTFAHGQGYANVRTEKGIQGVEFNYKLCRAFSRTPIGMNWGQARWESPSVLVIQTHQVGTDRTSECRLNVVLKPYTYRLDGGQLATAPLH